MSRKPIDLLKITTKSAFFDQLIFGYVCLENSGEIGRFFCEFAPKNPAKFDFFSATYQKPCIVWCDPSDFEPWIISLSSLKKNKPNQKLTERVVGGCNHEDWTYLLKAFKEKPTFQLTFVTLHRKTYSNGFPFSNSFPFTSCLSTIQTAWSPVCKKHQAGCWKHKSVWTT